MKKIWATELRAICAITGDLKTFSGPNVPGINWADANDYCQNNGLGYCFVVGELVCEIPCKTGTYEPDWKREIDYEKISMN